MISIGWFKAKQDKSRERKKREDRKEEEEKEKENTVFRKRRFN